MNTELIFFVEDEKFFSNVATKILQDAGFTNIRQFYSGESCKSNLYKNPGIIILDHMLGDTNGIDVLKEIKSVNPNIDVIFLSGQEEMQVAVTSLKYGAFDYVTKSPECLDQLKDSLQRLIQLRERISSKSKEKGFFDKIRTAFGLF